MMTAQEEGRLYSDLAAALETLERMSNWIRDYGGQVTKLRVSWGAATACLGYDEVRAVVELLLSTRVKHLFEEALAHQEIRVSVLRRAARDSLE